MRYSYQRLMTILRPGRRGLARPGQKRFVIAALSLVLAGALGMALSASLSSCHGGAEPVLRTPPDQRCPMQLPGVPTIRVRLTIQPAEAVNVFTTGPWRLTADGRLIDQSGSALPVTRLSRAGDAWQLGDRRIGARELIIEPLSPGRAGLDGTEYRGLLRFLPAGDDNAGVVAINHLDMESYLAGVLPKELYPHWSEGTYQAVAIAARTFALAESRTFGAGHEFDLYAGELSQCYGGYSAETAKSRQAVAATYGQALICDDGQGGQDIFLAQYSASCGGLVNPAGMIRQAPPVATLAGGQVCEDCRDAPRYRWPTVTVTMQQIGSALAACYPSAAGNLGPVSQVLVVSTTAQGRPLWVDVVGQGGRKVRLRAYDLRLALLRTTPAARGLYSVNCQIRNRGQYVDFVDGAGHGHGVGLCQWGAQAKALAGWSHLQILSFYYPQAKLLKVY